MSNLPLAFIIEDDRDIARVFAEALKVASYKVVTIFNGLEALARLKKQTPATIVLDIHIPGVNGADILKYLRLDQRFSKVKVILTTGDNRKAEEIQEMADLILIKPVGAQQLSDMALRMHPGNA